VKVAPPRAAVFFAADQAEAAAVVGHLAFQGIGATMDEGQFPRVTVSTLSQARLNEIVDSLRRMKVNEVPGSGPARGDAA
jgi:hypothetical protein